MSSKMRKGANPPPSTGSLKLLSHEYLCVTEVTLQSGKYTTVQSKPEQIQLVGGRNGIEFRSQFPKNPAEWDLFQQSNGEDL